MSNSEPTCIRCRYAVSCNTHFIYVDSLGVTVEELRKRLAENEGWVDRRMRMIYAGKQLEMSRTLEEYGIEAQDEVLFLYKPELKVDLTFDDETKQEVELFRPFSFDPLPFSQLKEDIALIFGVDAKEIGSIMRTGNTKLNDDEAGKGNEVKEGDQEEDDLEVEIVEWDMLKHGDVLDVERITLEE
eukprot:TRINITY_DN6266_c1_g3_i5.p1 TRINITY_DN6266_c1_g3~~TRINITY_DN6266_c1_g3_i5.p1  ORF type:complete len:186 (-),score=61.42 TRINITY_DN6266_c1_g3_i5:173-730(-)